MPADPAVGLQRLFLAAAFPVDALTFWMLFRAPLVSSVLTVCADKDEMAGLLFVKPVTSQR